MPWYADCFTLNAWRPAGTRSFSQKFQECGILSSWHSTGIAILIRVAISVITYMRSSQNRACWCFFKVGRGRVTRTSPETPPASPSLCFPSPPLPISPTAPAPADQLPVVLDYSMWKVIQERVLCNFWEVLPMLCGTLQGSSHPHVCT